MKHVIAAALLGGSLLLAQSTDGAEPVSAKTDMKVVYGKILEKKEVMGYDYLRVDRNGTEQWVAIAKAPVSIGDTIGYDTKTVIKNFKSKGLDRVFKEIVFANEVYLQTKKHVPGSMKEMLEKDIASAADTELVKDFKEKPVYTVEEVHRFRKQLNGKAVTVKAKVYKVSRQIMKRDWVHLGDGTGNEQKLTDDLVFTAEHAAVKEGENVQATAKIVVDKDFGYGYFYRVLGENARFEKQ